jgi:hypothetical protein
MSTLKHHYPELRALCKCKGRKQKLLLQKASGSLIRTVSQVAKNTIKGNIPLSPRQKQRLRRHKKTLRALSLAKSSLNKKRKLLIQKGGAFLPLLLGPILSAVAGSLFSR